MNQLRRVIVVGAPAAAESALVLLSPVLVYYAIRDFGASAQAGYGIGQRVLYTILLPGTSLAFALSPIAGQNFGAKNRSRVMEALKKAAFLGTAVMFITAFAVQVWPHLMLQIFDADGSSIAVAETYLRLMSWAFVAQGLIYVCSSMFQALGNTLPSLISSGANITMFSVGILCLSAQSTFKLEQIWLLGITVTTLQALLSLWLLRAEVRRRLPISSTQSEASAF